MSAPSYTRGVPVTHARLSHNLVWPTAPVGLTVADAQV